MQSACFVHVQQPLGLNACGPPAWSACFVPETACCAEHLHAAHHNKLKLGYAASLAVRLIGLWLVIASHNIIFSIWITSQQANAAWHWSLSLTQEVGKSGGVDRRAFACAPKGYPCHAPNCRTAGVLCCPAARASRTWRSTMAANSCCTTWAAAAARPCRASPSPTPSR